MVNKYSNKANNNLTAENILYFCTTFKRKLRRIITPAEDKN